MPPSRQAGRDRQVLLLGVLGVTIFGLQPFVALAASAALLGETVGWLEIGFAVLVVGIVALGWRMRVARPY